MPRQKDGHKAVFTDFIAGLEVDITAIPSPSHRPMSYKNIGGKAFPDHSRVSVR